MFKIGIGYDIHRLEEGLPLMLGGIRIPYSKGLAGHSDGDVLIHAIGDAILGAMGMGDIGKFYPDTDPAFNGMRSARILEDLAGVLEKEGCQIENIDTIVIAQEPKLAPFAEEIRSSLARALKLDSKNVNFKAKTAEKLDALGAGEGMAAHAAVIISRKRENLRNSF
ncbi:MAG TPA: 2-C-methyl-D-erythritol 2,4-cyclodiphosphate synthase [Nitrospiria bacterium]|nr:2-C-methyl-D-erythritol 2,4-cyclodiphosphate synthase [Nitrospiria bacterium]